MSTPSDPSAREATFFTTIRGWGLTRGDNGFLGGVVDGLAQRVGMALVPARIITVVAGIFLSGLMCLGYAAAWALLPDRKGNIIIQNFGRGMPNVGALVGIGIFTLAGLGGVDNGVPKHLISIPDAGGPWHTLALIVAFTVPVAIVATIVAVIVMLARRGGRPRDGEPPQYAAMPGQGGPRPAARPSSATTASSTTASPAADADHDATAEPEADARPGQATPAAESPRYAEPPVRGYGRAGAAFVPPVPPAPARRPRVPGPGKGFYLAALAWLVISAAGVAYAYREDRLAVQPAIAWYVLAYVGLGVLLVGVSLSGRKLGFLGFLGIIGALPTVAIAASADELRDAYARDDSILTFDFGTGSDASPAADLDATRFAAGEYATIVINGTCSEGTFVPSSQGSAARLTYASLDADTSADITAEVTRVTIPAGANVVVEGVGDAQAHVVFPDWGGEGVTCDFWGAGGTHLELSNPGQPTLHLVVHDDAYANTIVLTEQEQS